MCEPYRNRIETLGEFRQRTAWKDEPLRSIHVPSDQDKKICADGSFESLLGDTVLYDLSADACHSIGRMRNALYEEFSDILCTPFPERSFHITLHDLYTAPPGARDEVKTAVEGHKLQVDRLIGQFRVMYPDTIRLRPTKIVNMVSRSVVLLFEPVTDEYCMALTDMYSRLDAVVPLHYPFTPHVTLAYYKPQFTRDVDSAEAEAKLKRTIDHLGKAFGDIFREHPVEDIELNMHRLHYRCFTSMANYCNCDTFFKRLACTWEEFNAWQEFDKMKLIAQQQWDRGAPYRTVLRSMACYGLGQMSIARQERMLNRLFDRWSVWYDHDALCTNAVACLHREEDVYFYKDLCIVIIVNLYDRGLLNETAERCGADNLIHHLFFDLYWIR